MAENQKTVEEQTTQPQQAQQARQVWVHDPIAVSHCDVAPEGVTYTVNFVDFMGLERAMKFKREDCYFDFATVLKALVKNGFRYNTMIAQAPAMIQSHLTGWRPEAEKVVQALKGSAARNEVAQKEAAKNWFL